MSGIFRRRSIGELMAASDSPVRPDVIAAASAIVDDVRRRGDAAVREHAMRLDGLAAETLLVMGREAMTCALESLAPDERTRLTRIADRIRAFADGQRRSVHAFEMSIPG